MVLELTLTQARVLRQGLVTAADELVRATCFLPKPQENRPLLLPLHLVREDEADKDKKGSEGKAPEL